MNAVVEMLPASMPIPQTTSSAQLLAVLSRMMSDPSVDIERIERGAALYERAIARDAEITFNTAMAAVQMELSPIARDSNNPQTRSKYASYFAIDKAIRPVYGRHGFALSFDTEEGGPPDHTRVVALLSKGGHTQRYHYDSPIITKGMKGNEMMTLTHAGASAVTYAKRYLAGMIFNLSTGEDTDGNAPAEPDAKQSPPPPGSITQDQADEIRELLESLNVKRPAFLQWIGQKRIENVPAERFADCIEKIKQVGKADK